MKKTHSAIICSLFSLVVFLFNAQGAQAQNQGHTPPTVQETADREVAKMKTDLALTAEQEEKIKPIALKYAQKRKDVMDANKTDHAAAKTQLDALNTEMDAELKNVLTADQLTKWQTARSKQQQGPPQGGNRPAPSGKGGHSAK